MKLLNKIITSFLNQRIKSISRVQQHPHQYQEQLLNKIINQNASTEFGIEHQFKNIKRYHQFIQHVPIHTYNDLNNYIIKTLNGQQHVLCNHAIQWFAKSSASTSSAKLIPVTKQFLQQCHINGGTDLMAMYCYNNPHTQLFNGYNMALSGTIASVTTQQNKYYEGDISAIIQHHLPYWSIFFTNTYKNKITSIEKRIQHLINHVQLKDTVSLTGLPNWVLAFLEGLKQKEQPYLNKQLLPKLEVYFHGGVNIMPYKNAIVNLVQNPNLKWLEIYNATEGFFAIADDPLKNDLLLLLNNEVYYEFEEVEFPNKIIHLSEVNLYIFYNIIITNSSGLWRYKINDTIQFTNLWPYRIEIIARTNQYLTIKNVKISTQQIDNALGIAAIETNTQLRDYAIAPLNTNDTNNGLKCVVECIDDLINQTQFINCIDTNLKYSNKQYANLRNNNTIKLPVLTVVKNGTFQKWNTSLNQTSIQPKTSRFSSLETIDQIINIAYNIRT